MFSFIEVRAAAVNLERDDMKIKYGQNFEVECTKRIDAQFQTLIANNVRHVVLGAFGCGAFQNKPHIVTRVYMTAIAKYQTHFDVIAFPIINSVNNLRCFRDQATQRFQVHLLFKDLQLHNIGMKTPFSSEGLVEWQKL